MNISEIRFLRTGNIIAPFSGAIVSWVNIDTSAYLDATLLASFLNAFPTRLRLSQADLEAPLAKLIPMLLLAFTEQARLQPTPARLLQQADNRLQIWLPVDDRQSAEAAATLTLQVVQAVKACSDRLIPPIIKSWAALRWHLWNQTHAHLARASQELGIPFQRVNQNGQQFLQLGQGCQLRLFKETITDRTALFARSATNKEQLHQLLLDRGVPLPTQKSVSSQDQALTAATTIGWPVVLKPCAGGKGKGVWVGLSGPETLSQAWHSNAALGLGVQLVQQTLDGADHRLLVVNGALMAAAQRQPAAINCNGVQSLGDQIKALNADPERGVGYERLLNRVQVDGRLTLQLKEQGFTLDSVPPAGTGSSPAQPIFPRAAQRSTAARGCIPTTVAWLKTLPA